MNLSIVSWMVFRYKSTLNCQTDKGRGLENSWEKPAWRWRLLAFSGYCGFAPLLYLPAKDGLPDFVDLHRRQALGIALLLAMVTFFFVLSVAIASFAMVMHRSFYEESRIEWWLLWTSRKFYICWLVFWVFGLALSLLGSPAELPLVRFFMARRFWMRLALALWVGVYTLLALVGGAAVYANTLVRSDAAPGDVYLVYEDVGRLPRWLFAIGFCPIARVARDELGAQRAVILPISEETIARALKEGRFVFIGSHGGKQGMLLEKGRYLPPEAVDAMETHPDLRFVYLTSCDGGTQKAAWEAALAPAEVITFPRLTAVVEHAWWLWFRGPEVLQRVMAEPKEDEGDKSQ
jgi:hypothetical protein